MNAILSPCTHKRMLPAALLLLCVLRLSAQDPWREGINLAGITPTEEADARIGGRFVSGDFRKPSEGRSLWSAGASASAESRKDSLVLRGHFAFAAEYGRQMMGSMFTDPGFYPVDVLEFTPGPKSRQTYDIDGGLAWRNRSRWIPALNVRFRGVNYAKRKDLRYTAYRQEIEVVPSLLYRSGRFRAGISGVWEKNSEFIQAEQIGSATADTYYAFLDKGMRYGSYQAWDGSGIHLAESGVDRFPVKQNGGGLALQASWGERLYGDVSVRLSQGEVGEKGYTWFRFPTFGIDAKLLCLLPSGGGIHTLRADYSYARKGLYETVLDKETAGGVTTPVLYGSNRIFTCLAFSAAPSWRFDARSGWSLSAGLTLDHDRDLSTLVYPYWDQDVCTRLFVETAAVIPMGRFLVQAELGGGGRIGPLDCRRPGEEEGTAPFRLENWWEMEEEYQSAARVTAGLSLRYDLPGKLPLYVEAECRVLKAFRVEFLGGSWRQQSRIVLGYHF